MLHLFFSEIQHTKPHYQVDPRQLLPPLAIAIYLKPHPLHAAINQRRKRTALSDWLPVLQEREPSKYQRRKKSTVHEWLPILPWREPGKKQRRRKSALGNWLLMLREPSKKQGRKKSTLGD